MYLSTYVFVMPLMLLLIFTSGGVAAVVEKASFDAYRHFILTCSEDLTTIDVNYKMVVRNGGGGNINEDNTFQFMDYDPRHVNNLTHRHTVSYRAIGRFPEPNEFACIELRTTAAADSIDHVPKTVIIKIINHGYSIRCKENYLYSIPGADTDVKCIQSTLHQWFYNSDCTSECAPFPSTVPSWMLDKTKDDSDPHDPIVTNATHVFDDCKITPINKFAQWFTFNGFLHSPNVCVITRAYTQVKRLMSVSSCAWHQTVDVEIQRFEIWGMDEVDHYRSSSKRYLLSKGSPIQLQEDGIVIDELNFDSIVLPLNSYAVLRQLQHPDDVYLIPSDDPVLSVVRCTNHTLSRCTFGECFMSFAHSLDERCRIHYNLGAVVVGHRLPFRDPKLSRRITLVNGTVSVHLLDINTRVGFVMEANNTVNRVVTPESARCSITAIRFGGCIGCADGTVTTATVSLRYERSSNGAVDAYHGACGCVNEKSNVQRDIFFHFAATTHGNDSSHGAVSASSNVPLYEPIVTANTKCQCRCNMNEDEYATIPIYSSVQLVNGEDFYLHAMHGMIVANAETALREAHYVDTEHSSTSLGGFFDSFSIDGIINWFSEKWSFLRKALMVTVAVILLYIFMVLATKFLSCCNKLPVGRPNLK